MTALLGVGLVTFVLVIVLLILKHFFWTGRLKNVKNKHIVVTGGSSGIGKHVAITAAKHGANVTIIARNVHKLEVARKEILNARANKDEQMVEHLSLDIGANYENVDKALADLEKTMGPIYMLINCAGFAIPGKIEDLAVNSFHEMINVNLVGTYYCIKAVVQRMKAAGEGAIVITASQAAFLGIYGLAAYTSTKFALRGLAESLAMELRPYNISVTLSLPPDTDTPGYATEQLTKPLETHLISQTAGLVDPEVVAEKLFKDARAGKFFSTVGQEGFIMMTLCAGMSPFTSISELLLQASLMGLMRLVSAFYLVSFQRIILNCMKTRDKNKKLE
ncbi:PREDICTED: 3-ketodihydrosphingosine reductase [Dinoponera quadriceps]|uniref:3-dehydrosphinganine reductase n=1 Tax=Dinoponera quadriceps TaxID=609295 RepID=A0A6P3XCF7_DINQU|nr:PREDICTED: 3-ketodihydrosphingosine reductase [Dinoponera quadriceps]